MMTLVPLEREPTSVIWEGGRVGGCVCESVHVCEYVRVGTCKVECV